MVATLSKPGEKRSRVDRAFGLVLGEYEDRNELSEYVECKCRNVMRR